MIIQFHTPEGIVKVDSNTVTDAELAALNITREALNDIPGVSPSPDEIRVGELLATSPSVITQPEIWELLRIIGRRLGYKFEQS